MGAEVKPVWIVNDVPTCIPGTKTLWHNLLEWIPGAEWASSGNFATLSGYITTCVIATHEKPGLIIRNASYFPHVETDIPQVAILQDIFPPGPARDMQVAVCRKSVAVVVNSPYTAAQYPELGNITTVVIPLPVDFDLFGPMPEVAKEWDVCWIGAASSVKGWDIFHRVMMDTDLTYLLVMKDVPASSADVPLDRVKVVRRVPHSELPALNNSCRIGLCTSRQETQHLAGIEMGACGLPMVAPNVGAYFGQDAAPPWGIRVTAPSREGFSVAVGDALRRRSAQWGVSQVRSYWEERYTPSICRESWLALVAEVTA
jgi:glycosyltransferase involved in cell wall biosynthesis